VDVIARARSQLAPPSQLFSTSNRRRAGADTPIVLSFQKLDVYQVSIEFLSFVHRLLPGLPKGHADLADQLRRSAQSTPQNIAEGAGRMSKPDKVRHYTIARGSAMESASHLDVMKVEGLVDDERYLEGIGLLERVVGMLTKLVDP
jgi:four helix bundle protein